MRFDSIRSFFVNVVRRATSESVPGGNRAVRNRPRSRSLALESLETRELLCAVSSSLLEISAAELVGDSVVAAAATVAAPERLDNAVANDRYDIVYSLREEGVVRTLGQTGVQNYSSMSYCAITDPIYLELWEKAIERWENVISEDLADITYPYAVDGVTDMRIDDLYLDLGFSASFSSRSTLGSALNAGCYRDAGRGTAATGSLVFNAKYFVANPSSTVQTVFYNTALHEIAHTLGYNIAHFDKVGLLESSHETPYALDDLFDSGSSYYYYVGEKGVEQYRQAFPAAMINQSTTPDKFVMETYTASGSFGAHPSSILATYNLHLNQRDGVNYAISSLFEGTITTTTLGVMEDLGYTVDYNFADALGSPVPENLTAETVGEEVALNWNKAAGDLSNADSGPARYQIERIDANELDGSGQEDGWRVIATDVEETTYRDATVEPGREYVYRVRASYIRTNKEIDVFRAKAGQQLSWDSDETKFTIYALVNKGANAVGWDRVVASTSNKSWTATSLSSKPGAGATLFRVVAVGAILDSTGPSRAARVNVVAVPKTLDAPTCKSSASTSDSVTIAWDHVANASGYVVEYKSADDPGYTVMPITNDATMTITNLAPETTYKLRLYAVGDGMNFVDSPYSPVKAVKTKVAPVVPVDAVPLDAPTWKSSSSTANSVTVAWN
ncbi:MAG: fibronectin type III domain-containing protein, partial [Thermoguttaceae bacterium]|nr:fibronectin type III domain-containing protein [Thermoguttaceae bacterium]